MRKKIRALLIVTMALFIFGNGAYAMSLLNKVPAVTGTVIDTNGLPLEGVSINVKFFGTDDKLFDGTKKVYTIKEFNAVSDSEGRYSLEGTSINLPKLKSKFTSAEITFSHSNCTSKMIQAVNMRVMGGAPGVFLLGIIDAQGEFDGEGSGVFPAVAHAYKTMKDSKFSRVYKTLIEDEPMRLERTNGANSKGSRFKELYK